MNETKACPHCGAQHGMREAIGRVALGPVMLRMAQILADAGGRYVRTSALVDAVYGGTAGGGPVNADLIVRMTAHKIRPRLAAAGLDLVSHPGSGYALRWAS